MRKLVSESLNEMYGSRYTSSTTYDDFSKNNLTSDDIQKMLDNDMNGVILVPYKFYLMNKDAINNVAEIEFENSESGRVRLLDKSINRNEDSFEEDLSFEDKYSMTPAEQGEIAARKEGRNSSSNSSKEKLENRKAYKILKFIGSKGEEGASLTEIQYFIHTELFERPEESFWTKETGRYNKGQRQTRGLYNTNLYGDGLLNKWCYKNSQTKKWVLKRLPEPGENLYQTRKNHYNFKNYI